MREHSFSKLVLVAGAFLAGASIAQSESGDGDQHWSYEGDHGPSHWGGVCTLGTQQSPVNIEGQVKADVPKIEIAWKNSPGQLENNGHTILVDFPAGSLLRRGDDTYELVHVHFHAPSEHHVNGKAYPMEAHFVHRHVERGTLGVVGVFLVAGKSNESFAHLASAFPAESGGKDSVAEVDLAALLPADLDYWSYKGSLTTPPCSEEVDWMVVQQPLEVGETDIARFTASYQMNARPIAPLNTRSILSSR